MCLFVVTGGAVSVTLRGEGGSLATVVGAFLDGAGVAEVMMSDEKFVRRRSVESPDPRGGQPEPPSGMGLPALWRFLAWTRWDDGSERTPGSLTLFVDADRLKVALNDRDAGEVGFATLDADEEPLAAINDLLVEGKIDWRPARGARKK